MQYVVPLFSQGGSDACPLVMLIYKDLKLIWFARPEINILGTSWRPASGLTAQPSVNTIDFC